MSELELPLALRIERLSRFIDRLSAIVSDDIKVSIEADSVIVKSEASQTQIFFMEIEAETSTASRILDEIQVLYADLKSEYWPQLGQARLEYRVASTADGLELEFRLP